MSYTTCKAGQKNCPPQSRFLVGRPKIRNFGPEKLFLDIFREEAQNTEKCNFFWGGLGILFNRYRKKTPI